MEMAMILYLLLMILTLQMANKSMIVGSSLFHVGNVSKVVFLLRTSDWEKTDSKKLKYRHCCPLLKYA